MQADGGAGVRHHQVGDGLSPVPAARFGERPERMDAGVLGVVFETYGRIAYSEVGESFLIHLDRPQNRTVVHSTGQSDARDTRPWYACLPGDGGRHHAGRCAQHLSPHQGRS